LLAIRKEQIEAFEFAALARFESRLLNHVHEYFPKHWRLVGEHGLRQVIRLGIERGGRYGLSTERDIYLYVSLMLYLGCYFDDDVQLPWVRRSLREPESEAPSKRIAETFDKAMAFMDEVFGPDGECYLAALTRIRGGVPASLDRSVGGVVSPPDVLALLEWIHPEKYGHVREADLYSLIDRAVQAAAGYGLRTGRGVLVYSGLMFTLGEKFDEDPRFRWATSILKKPTQDDANKVAQLYDAAIAYLNEWFE